MALQTRAGVTLAALQAGKRPAAPLGAVSTTRYVSHCLTENEELFEFFLTLIGDRLTVIYGTLFMRDQGGTLLFYNTLDVSDYKKDG